jgi:hypothetical protein
MDGSLPKKNAPSFIRRFPFAATHLLESAPQECFTGAYEDLPHLPAYLPG